MLVIALTGGIGSGKTTVSNILSSKGIPVIDTDIIARKVAEQGKPAYLEIIESFGSEILSEDKNINRQKLANIIFSSENKRKQLENILHPIIWDEVKSQILLLSSAEKPAPYCIIVVPLLFESSPDNLPVRFDRILVIDTDEETQIKRAIKRDGRDEPAVRKIINSQVNRNNRTNSADDIILNTGNLNSLENSVLKLHEKYKNMSP